MRQPRFISVSNKPGGREQPFGECREVKIRGLFSSRFDASQPAVNLLTGDMNQEGIMAVAIVLAGGSGSRMNSGVAKQYMLINEKEVIFYSLSTFQKNEHITDIVLVARNEDLEYCKNEIVNKYGFDKVRRIVSGGKERYASVYQGLLAVGDIFKADANISGDNIIDNFERCSQAGVCGNQIVLIHDGARPFVTNEMIHASIECAKETGACTVGVPVKDTIKIVDENMNGVETPDRKFLYQIQTPQTFEYKLIMAAYEKMHSGQNAADTHEKAGITDDTMLVELYTGVKSKVIFGSYENIKITTPEDINIAEIFSENFLKI